MSTKVAQKNRSGIAKFRDPAQLHAILDTVPDAMVLIDEQGRILTFSVGAEKMFGYREDELIGQNVSRLMPSPDRDRHNSYIDRYLETGEKKIIGIGRITNARRSNGKIFPVELSVNETMVGGKRVFVGFLRDLTSRQEATKKLHALQSELAHVSRISSMGSLATSIAHELNQPLTAIANYVESARDLLDSPAGADELPLIRQALEESAAEAVRAGTIVRKLREFISGGETERMIVSLERLLGEAVALALIDGQGTDVSVDINLDPEANDILVEPVHVQQVMVNLLRNAVEAMQQSTDKRIEISSHQHDDSFVEVAIADSGPGIDHEIAERLFEPFLSTKESGMGLGLSICHTIVNGHGGKIWAGPSELGGTKFHFTLPLMEKADG